MREKGYLCTIKHYRMDINNLITSVNDVIWGDFLIYVLIACGLWFTWRTRFVQFRMVGEMFRLLKDATVDTAGGEKQKDEDKTKKNISSFQAFIVSVSTRVGTGNLAGVASAIAIGGPGAVFWMWVIALIGSATAFVESTLAQLYKQRNQDSYIGGPAYYIQKGLKNRWMAIFFAVFITLQFGLTNNSIQANTMCTAMEEAFGLPHLWVGCTMAAVSLFIVFGGIQRIASVCTVLVPIMAIGYLLLAIVVIALNIELVPHVFKVIFLDAFGIQQVAGGGIGMTIMMGVKRGLFSNEAGEGSAPNVAATATTSHPVKQGLIQALGVFTDTLLLCSCTAFIIIISGLYTSSGNDGIVLTQSALQAEVGNAGPIFVALAIFLFAYSTIIGNYYYGEANVRFITKSPLVMTIYRILSGGVMILFGAVASFDLVWDLVDFFMAFLTICNLIAIVILGRYAFRLLDDYREQKRQGIQEPTFHRSLLPELENEIECWE